MEVNSKPKPEEIQASWEREGSNALLLGLGCYEDDEEEEQLAAMKAAFEVRIPLSSHAPNTSLRKAC